MTARSLIFGRVSGHAPLTALVGGKIYWGPAPQNTVAPYVTYQVITDRPVGSLGGNTTLANGAWQFDCYANDPSTAELVAGAVIAALDKWRGEDSTGYVVVRLDEVRELPEPDVGLARISLDFRIWTNKEE